MRRKALTGVLLLAVTIGLVGWWLWPKETLDGPRAPRAWGGAKAVGPGIDILAQDVESDGPIFGDIRVAPRNYDEVRAFRLADGAAYWTYRRTWPLWKTVPMTGLVRLDERHVAAVWCDDRISAIDVRTGTITWSIDLPKGPEAARCAADNDETAEDAWGAAVADPADPVLIIQRAERIDALAAATGRPRWHAATSHGTPLNVFGRSVVAQNDHGITLLDAHDGRPLWSPRGCPMQYEVIVGLGDLLAACDRTALTVYQARDGRPLWRIPQAGGDLDPWQLTRAGNLVLIRTDESLTAYQATTGRVAWRTPSPIIDRSLPAVMADGRLAYTQTADSTLIQVDTRTGRIVGARNFAGASIVMSSVQDDILQVLLADRHVILG
jgi:outer membrane protein assembly factor BamB